MSTKTKLDWLPDGARAALTKRERPSIHCPIPGASRGASLDLSRLASPAAKRDGLVLFLRSLGMAAGLVDKAAEDLDASPEAGDLLQGWTLSTKRVDSYKDTVDADGWMTEDFGHNPVVLFAHKSDALPVGRDMGVWIDPGKALKGVTRFASPDVYAFGATVGKLVAAGFLNAVSVGFEPVEFEVSEERSDENDWFPSFDFKKQILREYSVVPIPANMDALADGRTKAGIDLSPIVQWAEEILDTRSDGLFLPRAYVENLRRAGLGGKQIAARAAADVGAFFVKADAEAESPNLDVPTDAETPSSGSAATTGPLDKGAACTCPSCGWEGTVEEALVESTEPMTHACCPSCKAVGTFEEWSIEAGDGEAEPPDVVEEAVEPEEAVEAMPLEAGDRVVVNAGEESDPAHVGVGGVVEDVADGTALILFDGATESVEYPVTALALEEPTEEKADIVEVEPTSEEGEPADVPSDAMCLCPACGYEGGVLDFVSPASPEAIEEESTGGGGDSATKAGQTPGEFESLAARVALATVREVRRQVTERTGRLP